MSILTDPFSGLLEYIKTVKPYHTQLLDVVAEYRKDETVTATITDELSLDIEFANDPIDSVILSGYGIVWDPSGSTSPEATPSYTIQKATNVAYYNAAFVANSANITITGTTGYVVGNKVVFETTGTFPSYSGSSGIAGQQFSIVAVGSGTIQVALENQATPITWTSTGTGSQSVRQVDHPTNNVRFTVPAATYFPAVITDIVERSVVFVGQYTINAVNVSSKQFTVDSNATTGDYPVTVGSSIYVRSNAFSSANKTYTVTGVAITGSNTRFTVAETIPTGTTISGFVMAQRIADQTPGWETGTQVKVSASGTLPGGLSATAVYYLVTTNAFGKFALSEIQYPRDEGDYIEISSIGDNTLQLTRWIPYNNGQQVTITGSVNGAINGSYTVIGSNRSGNVVDITVMPDIARNTPSGQNSDGVITLYTGTFGSPTETAAVSSGDSMRVQASISDRIIFELI